MDMVNDVLGPGLYNNVRLAIDRETGRQRGFGHIDFKGSEENNMSISNNMWNVHNLTCPLPSHHYKSS